MKKLNYIIRPIKVSDAEYWLDLLKQLSLETEFMLYSSEDRSFDLKNCQKILKKFTKTSLSQLLIVEVEDNLVGYLLAQTSDMKKRKHILTLSGGILKKYQFGFGRKLIQKIIEHGKEKNIKKIEMSVIAENCKCINLAKKIGFKIEGVKIASIFNNDSYEDEILMGYLL